MKAIFVVFTIFAVCLYTASSQRVKCPTEWPDNVDYILIPNPCDCSSYFVCQGELATILTCPPFLHFDANRKQCDYTNKAHCVLDPKCPEKPL